VHCVERLLSVLGFENAIAGFAENTIGYPAGITLVVNDQDRGGGAWKRGSQVDSWLKGKDQ
jgi:hypothetical protein